jgi:ferric-dicitrate binding protein FerR (iron transport regulator)
MNDRITQGTERDERALADIIRHAGSRAQPPAAVRDAVRAAAEEEWRAVVADRARRRRSRWSLAAAAAVAGLSVWLVLPTVQAPAAVVASVTRVAGPVDMGGGLFSRSTPVQPGAAVMAAAEIRSGPGGRVALQMGSTSVRMDQDSVITVSGPGRVALARGAIYVDADPAARESSPLVIETEYGNVQHLGTQFETRLARDGLRVRVREGHVRIMSEQVSLESNAGEQVTLSGAGDVRREAAPRSGGEWAWVGEITPPFDIEGRSLAGFLHWVARETGREVVYSTPASEAEAARVILRGSVEGLTPERALAAVLATTQLSSGEAPGQLLIDLRPGDR